MSTSLDVGKSELIGRLGDYAREHGGPGTGTVSLPDLARAYYRHVAPEDLLDRGESDLLGAVTHHLALAEVRPQGTANIAVFTPRDSEEGWSAHGRTVVEVVTDDMPFLVDSVSMALDRLGHEVHLVIHPQFVCRRELAGQLQEVLGDRSATSAHDVQRESWMHLEVDRVPEAAVDGVRQRLAKVLTDVREAVEDWPRMHARTEEIAEELAEHPPVSLDAAEVEQGRALLLWLADNHFTFLGYREYRLANRDGADVLVGVPGTGYGILRTDPTEAVPLPPEAAARAREKQLLVLAKANSRATVHRPVHLDYVGVKQFDADGEVVGERRFLGLFSSAAHTESVSRIPVLREKAQAVLAASGFEPMSHAGKALMDVLESYPREELFQVPIDQLVSVATQVIHTRERRQLKLFVRRDTYGRFFSCLVYLPRDRYNASVGHRIARMLQRELRGETVEFTAHVGETFAARVHLVIRPEAEQELVEPDVAELERRCAALARSWRDDFIDAVLAQHDEDRAGHLARAYADAFPEAYKEDYPATVAARDAARLAEADESGGMVLGLETAEGATEDFRLKFFRVGERLTLSEVLPVLASMGVQVVDERPYEMEGLDRPTHIYDFGLRWSQPLPESARSLFTDTVRAVWDGGNETDGFNALVLAVGLDWRRATLLRAYAKYLRQGGTPFAQDYIEEALRLNPEITRLLVELFEERFDPGRPGPDANDPDRVRRCTEIEEELTGALDQVVSLDQDRILRSYLTSIRATLRTNFYQRGRDGAPHPYIALKLEPDMIDYLPEPRPRFEIFVYSPRVEGVHLRFGAVARGGLRWSDRRDDFRTEVLGLVKAQMVKNTVIVPVGAKGGFFPKMLPVVDPAQPATRDAWLEEGKASYRTFVSGLLDLTDNIVDGETVAPAQVVRHDGDDSYLVVAADKGTATFSDLANSVAQEYGYWLGDAFASGGSAGYDHKEMGITARGAWVSVRRHFREMGVDCQNEDFTCVGIGDMSGDVFGNGMLSSEHIRLVAAFDHRDIFLDPDPDPATSYAERKRLFELPRSSWQDYDTSLISEGGGVWSRSAKSIPLSPQACEALGTDATSLTPAELMRTILLAPVDLLWNGGIGTYVKSAQESHADAGDKSNDAIRVDGAQLRARCVGEGGNLGFTQRGRIEYAANGGRLNTDFIDNSAGVDTSDHEVNIKILLDHVVAQGELTEEERNRLLASMTDEVANLVLADNYQQNLALANAQEQAPALLHVHEDWMRTLERAGLLNRQLEALPSRKEVAGRLERKEGLTTPELAVLLAYTKIALSEWLLDTDIAEDPFLRSDLYSYFPSPMRQDYRGQMEQHQLRREIIVTQIVNQLVNGAGISFHHRLGGETSAPVESLVRANFVAREIFGSEGLWRRIAALDNQIDARLQTRMRLEVRTLTERASRWLVNNRRPPLDSEALVAQFEVVVEKLMGMLPELMTGSELVAFEERRDALVEQGVPEELAVRVAGCPPAYALLGVVDTCVRDELDAVEVARTHFALGERLGLPLLVSRILALPRDDRWQTMARAALRDDLHTVHAQLTAQSLAGNAPDQTLVDQATRQLEEICADEGADLARLSVALRVVRSLLA